MSNADWAGERPFDIALHAAVCAVATLAVFLVLALAYMPRSTSARLESGDFTPACIPTISNAMCRGNFNPDATISIDRITYTEAN